MPNCIVDYFEWKKAQKYWKFLVLKNCAKILVFLLPIMVIFQIGNGLIPAHKTPFFQPVICRFGTLGLFWIKKAQKCIDNFWILKIVLNFWYFFYQIWWFFKLEMALFQHTSIPFFQPIICRFGTLGYTFTLGRALIICFFFFIPLFNFRLNSRTFWVTFSTNSRNFDIPNLKKQKNTGAIELKYTYMLRPNSPVT